MNRNVIVSIGFVVVLACVGPARARASTFAGTVVFQGKPASGVTVWLHCYEGGSAKLIETRTDGQGKFHLSGPGGEDEEVMALIARAADGRIGWHAFARRSPEDSTADGDVKIMLLPIGEARGRLTDGAEAPIARLKVEAQTLSIRDGNSPDWPNALEIPAKLAQFFQATTTEDGTFAVSGIPLNAQVYAAISAPTFGDLNIGWNQGQTGEFRLAKPGRLRVSFQGADDYKKLAGVSLYIDVRSRGSERESADAAKGPAAPFIAFNKAVKSPGTETLDVPIVLPGHGHIYFESSENAPYVLPVSASIDIKPGEQTEVRLTVSPAARVRGRVVDAETGKGIAGAKVLIHSRDKKKDQYLGQTAAKTAADGTYAVYARPGQITASPANDLPVGYTFPVRKRRQNDSVVVAGGKEHTFADIVLQPAVPLEGFVVDDAGKPVPGVTVHSAAWEPTFEAVDPRTDDKGRFVLRSLGANEITALRVRTPGAVTDGAIPVDLAKDKGPITLVVSKKFACRLKGRVVDAAGKPIVGAKVGVAWHVNGVGRAARWGQTRVIETLRSDADGRFQSPALWPGDRYELSVSSPGYATNQVVVPRGEAGKTHDFPAIALMRINAAVAGVVVDSAGKPIGGVNVFNQGDAKAKLTATTGADGRFHLEGLYDGGVYVFARKPGYRFAMQRLASGTTGARILVLRNDEPAPPAPPSVRTPQRIAAERKAADYLIDKVLALPGPATGGYQSNVFEYLVRIDPDRARKWLAVNKPKAGIDSPFFRFLRSADVKRAAAEDADEAVTLAESLRPRFAIPLLLDIADRFEKKLPAQALRLAEGAIVRARTLDRVDQAQYLARAGGLAMRLGKQASGKKLFEEAVAIGAKFGTDERSGFNRALIANHLAVHDLPAARALVNGPTRETDRYLSMLAMQVASKDSKTALALVNEMKADGSSSRARTQMLIARRVAQRDPAEAVRILEGIDDVHYKVRYQAEGLAHVAAVVAPRDRKLAWTLIDRSLALYLDHAEELRSWSGYGGSSVFAAWTAGQAQAVDYPDMPGVMARVLACRPTDEEAHSPAHKVETMVRMAKVLALIDPAAARDILKSVEPHSNLLGTGYNGFEQQDWLMARGLADPERAPALIDEAIAGLAKQKGQMDFYGSGLMQLADVLTAAPAQRLSAVMGLNSSISLDPEHW